MDGDGYIVPRCGHQVVAKARCRRETNGVKDPVDSAEMFPRGIASAGNVFGIGDVELGNRARRREFLGGALRDGKSAPRTRQHHRGTLFLGQLGDAKSQRCVREYPGNDQPLPGKNCHVATVVDMTTSLPSIGYLGGTGPAGSALAVRLASVGYPGVIGSRTAERGREVVAELLTKWADRGLQLTGGDNAQAAACDIIVLATPWDSAATTVTELSPSLEGKIVITMANALVRVGREFQPLIPPRGSIAAHVQAAIPKSNVVAAFQHLPATELGALDHKVDSDVLICSDDPQSTKTVSEIVSRIAGCRPLNAGLLSNALAIEALTAVLLQLNVRYKTRVAPRFTGID